MMLYVLKCNEYYKIGITKDFKKRIHCYNTHNPSYILVKSYNFILDNVKNRYNTIIENKILYQKILNIEKEIIRVLKSNFEFKQDWIKMTEKDFNNFTIILENKFNKH